MGERTVDKDRTNCLHWIPINTHPRQSPGQSKEKTCEIVYTILHSCTGNRNGITIQYLERSSSSSFLAITNTAKGVE